MDCLDHCFQPQCDVTCFIFKQLEHFSLHWIPRMIIHQTAELMTHYLHGFQIIWHLSAIWDLTWITFDALSWSEHGVNDARVKGSIPVQAIQLRVGLDDPCGSLPQNILRFLKTNLNKLHKYVQVVILWLHRVMFLCAHKYFPNKAREKWNSETGCVNIAAIQRGLS